MFKTLAFAIVIAAVAAAPETAHAVDSANGISANGLTSNGLTSNGLSANGLKSNGLTSNGAAPGGRVFGIELPSVTRPAR
jgi:hypothetical protein